MNSTSIVILFGLISTIQLHIAKAMERQGIEIFDQIRAKLKKEKYELEEGESALKKPAIYIVGLALNNTIFVYAMIANMFGPPAIFTSMFGIGLVALLFYSRFVLKEEIKPIEYVGALVLITGTVVVGIEGFFREAVNPAEIDVTLFFVVVGIYLVVMGALVIFSIVTRKAVALIFGLFAGGCGGLDPVFKQIGGTYGQETTGFLPASLIGWVIFLLSFGIASFAFLFTQWGFARKARASVLVPTYNSTYVGLPLVVYSLILPTFVLTGVTYAGLVLVIAGIVLMQAFKPMKPPPELKEVVPETSVAPVSPHPPASPAEKDPSE